MSAPPDGERIAALETNMTNLIKQIDAINLKLDGVIATLNEMSGGKKALLGLFAMTGGLIGALAALFGLHLFGK